MLRTADKLLYLGGPLARVTHPARFARLPLDDSSGSQCISSWSGWGLGPAMAAGGSTGAWPSANRAVFIPFRVPFPVVVEKMAFGCGSTGGGNVDIGIYDENLNRVVSTGAVSRAANTGIVTDVTDTTLQPGFYYLAMSVSNTGNMTTLTNTNLGFAKLMGARQMDTAHPLPSTATLATLSSALVPIIGAYISPAFDDNFRNRPPFRWPPLNVITPFHPESQGIGIRGSGASLNSTASQTPGSNIVTLSPFSVLERATVVKLSLLVGATSNGNADVGLYNHEGTLLVSSGSTALGATNTLQEFDVTDTVLEPGGYYMACQLSSGTATIFRLGGQGDEFAFPSYRSFQNNPGSFGLPSTITPAETTGTSATQAAMGVHFSTLI